MIIVAATQNQHKIKEIQTIIKAFGYELVDQKAAGLAHMDVEEDGDTFEANSFKKAMEIHKACGRPTIADDSGLMVDVLDGAPGVYSARFSGESATDEKNNEKLLKLLAEVPEEKRTAKFVSVVTLVFGEGDVVCARGECPGRILFSGRGSGGFGYDPLFLPDGQRQTFAELGAEVKNRISHRAKALQTLRLLLEKRKRD